MFARLEEIDAQVGLYFKPFYPDLALTHVIVGATCTLGYQEVSAAVVDGNVELIKSRAAFKSFNIVPDRRGCNPNRSCRLLAVEQTQLILPALVPSAAINVCSLCIADVGDGTQTHGNEWRTGPRGAALSDFLRRAVLIIASCRPRGDSRDGPWPRRSAPRASAPRPPGHRGRPLRSDAADRLAGRGSSRAGGTTSARMMDAVPSRTAASDSRHGVGSPSCTRVVGRRAMPAAPAPPTARVRRARRAGRCRSHCAGA